MTKNFPKSRLCVIDCYSSLELGLKKAIEFTKSNNIMLNSQDGKKIILAFSLREIEETYKTTQSIYPKVLCISKKRINNKLKMFIDSYFDNMMKYLPFPYCGKFDLESPDLESAAENSLAYAKTQRSFKRYASKLGLKL